VLGHDFISHLLREGFDFAAGVPCSLIEDLIRELETGCGIQYVPAIREDAAVGLAAGAWLAGRRPLVVMQNSGLGTSLNALVSLSQMYELPLLLIVTWRGYGGNDAPEHIFTGSITEPLLGLLGIPYRVLSAASAGSDAAWAAAEMDRRSAPVALIVPPKLFGSGGHQTHIDGALTRAVPPPPLEQMDCAPTISRAAAIAAAIKSLDREAVIHANGFPSRESHAILDRPQNFYMLGSMGLASAIGLGVALTRSTIGTVIFDGDGNLLMNFGIMPMVGALSPRRYVHCVFDNGVYGSTGNQRSPAPGLNFTAMAAAAGYRTAASVTDAKDVSDQVATALHTDGPHFIHVRVTAEATEVPRINHTPSQIRDRFRAGLADGATQLRAAVAA
jgi:phosphonopyruvate decarboxylase